MPNYSWPAMDKRRIMGTPIKRLDGPVKSSGRAKYNSDVHPAGMLYGTLVTSPHAHARIVSIDLSAAQKMPGVTAVRAIKKAGDEIQWAGTELVSIAAPSSAGAPQDDKTNSLKVLRVRGTVSISTSCGLPSAEGSPW